MNTKILVKLSLLLFTIIIESPLFARYLSPFDYGLGEARNGEEVYWALYQTHTQALSQGATVDYRGVGDLSITIPKSAQSIPLGRMTDFKGITITVNNDIKDFFLFSLENSAREIMLPQNTLDKDDFSRFFELRKGMHLLILIDENAWSERIGFDNFYPRADVRIINNGKAINNSVMPYGNSSTTKPICKIADVTKYKKSVKNITVVRSSASKNKTNFLSINFNNNVLVSNVRLITPEDNNQFADRNIWIRNSSNITLEDIIIEGSYSQTNRYGYGIEMNNVYNSKFIRLVGRAPWGIFGNNNINTATLLDCEINRFDIHNYGRDITIKGCRFNDLYVQFSSTYGTIRYVNCIFHDSIPVLNGGTYNAYVPHNIEMKNCLLYITKKEKDRLCQMGTFAYGINPRPELSKKAWPNISINGLKIILSEGIDEFYIFRVNGQQDAPIEGIENVIIKKLEMSGAKLLFCDQNIKTVKPIRYSVNGKTSIINN